MKLDNKDYFFYFLYLLLLFLQKVFGGLLVKILEVHPQFGAYANVQKNKKASKKAMKGSKK